MRTRICSAYSSPTVHKLYLISDCSSIVHSCQIPEIPLHQASRMMLNVRSIPSLMEYLMFHPRDCSFRPSISAMDAVEYPFVSSESGSSYLNPTPHCEASRKPNPSAGSPKQVPRYCRLLPSHLQAGSTIAQQRYRRRTRMKTVAHPCFLGQYLLSKALL